MQTILIDIDTKEVRGFNREPRGIEFEVQFPGSLSNITKSVPSNKLEYAPDQFKTMYKKVTIKDSRSDFNLEDVLEAKYEYFKEDNDTVNHVTGDEFINESHLGDTSEANSGNSILELLPNGSVDTVEKTLEETTDTLKLLEFYGDEEVEVLVNGVSFTSGEAVLDSLTDKITITFNNPTSKRLDVKGYVIGY